MERAEISLLPDFRKSAILLDIDGTILDLAPSPQQVWVPTGLRQTLARLDELTGGALALVSGRSLNDIDLIFSPPELAAIGGHGAEPQVTKDPIVIAGEFIVQLQTVVSRQENPREPSVVTIGDIHGGTKRNIIPYEVKMEITARTFSDRSRQIVVDGIRRTAQGVALSAGVPDNLAPIVTVLDAESTPVMYNDPALAARVKSALIKTLGAGNVFDDGPAMASEDFGVFGLEGHKIPTVMFGLGAMDPTKFAEAQAAGKTLPGPHTSLFQPSPEPTLRTGVTAMSSVAIALLQH